MSIIVENEKCIKGHQTLPLRMNTQCNCLFFNQKDNSKLCYSKYFGAFPSELTFLYLKIHDLFTEDNNFQTTKEIFVKYCLIISYRGQSII